MTGRGAGGVVIVGGGHAGGRTAERLRHEGFVGPIDVVGLERELPYERPPLSKNMLTAPEMPTNAYLLPAARWSELGIRFHLGTEALRIDRAGKSVALSDGGVLAYRKLVLATGLSPRRLDAVDAVASYVNYLRSFDDASALRAGIGRAKALVLVGAGLIGLEVAASAAKLGAQVTVIEASDRPLGRMMPPHVSRWLSEVHRKEGVRILCGREVRSALATETAAMLELDDGTSLRADLILVGIGGTPNDTLAAEAGLETQNGILVNAFCQTSDADVYAVGDVTSHVNPIFERRWRLESWKNAEDQAAVAASHIAGKPVPYGETPWFWTDQYDFNIQVAGMPGDGPPSLERGTIGQRGYLAYSLDGDRLQGAVGISCGRDIRIAREVIKAGGKIDRAELRTKGFAAPVEHRRELERQAS